jgi:hypothetical protein
MSKGPTRQGRETRLSAALRENLRRRKAQAQARAGRGEPDERDPESPEPDREKNAPGEGTA